MRRALAILAIAPLAACGDDAGARHDAGTTHGDVPIDMPAIDAPALEACTPTSGTTVSVRKVAQITGSALLVTAPPNDGRLFVVMQDGTIRIVQNGQVLPDPFLDLSNTSLLAETPQGERGLLGLAFSPNYAGTREFYVYYTTATADVVARYHASATDPNKADTTGEIILSIPDPFENHNAGMLEFGPKDGYLYISTGDGGSAGDPRRNAQAVNRSGNIEPLLGKMLRIDVSTTSGVKNYGIPSTNPYAGGGGEPEIFMIGLRNPWRWAFDKPTGDMWIGDVGQGMIEEIDVLKDGQAVGKNLGWSMYEASSCYGNYTCDPNGMTMPQYERTHGQGWLAIIGGDVYRGPCYPDLDGTYFFTDNTRHILNTAKLQSDGSLVVTEPPVPGGGWPGGPSSIHKDARGELYMTTTTGGIWHIEAGP